MGRAKKHANIVGAKVPLSELAQRASTGDEVVIVKDNVPLAKRVPIRAATGKRQPGSGKGEILWMSPDFDETPEAFNDYVP